MTGSPQITLFGHLLLELTRELSRLKGVMAAQGTAPQAAHPRIVRTQRAALATRRATSVKCGPGFHCVARWVRPERCAA